MLFEATIREITYLVIEKFEFWVKTEAAQGSSMAIFSNFLKSNLKNGFARSF